MHLEAPLPAQGAGDGEGDADWVCITAAPRIAGDAWVIPQLLAAAPPRGHAMAQNPLERGRGRGGRGGPDLLRLDPPLGLGDADCCSAGGGPGVGHRPSALGTKSARRGCSEQGPARRLDARSSHCHASSGPDRVDAGAGCGSLWCQGALNGLDFRRPLPGRRT
jgi:hypothetical protein